jgi:hypothetical protein
MNLVSLFSGKASDERATTAQDQCRRKMAIVSI